MERKGMRWGTNKPSRNRTVAERGVLHVDLRGDKLGVHVVVDGVAVSA